MSMGYGIGSSDKTPRDLKRLREHAAAAVSVSETKAAMIAADEFESSLSVGEHPDTLAAAAEDTDRALAAHVAARAVERRAYLAYTNPFGVKKTV